MTSRSLALPDCPSSPPFDNSVDTYKYSSGSTYSGEWMNGQRHGRGTYVFGINAGKTIIYKVVFWSGIKYEGI